MTQKYKQIVRFNEEWQNKFDLFSPDSELSYIGFAVEYMKLFADKDLDFYVSALIHMVWRDFQGLGGEYWDYDELIKACLNILSGKNEDDFFTNLFVDDDELTLCLDYGNKNFAMWNDYVYLLDGIYEIAHKNESGYYELKN